MSLLDRIKALLEKRRTLARDSTGAEADLELQAATAILLLEAAYGDTQYVWREDRAIVAALERDFGLGRREVRALLGRANEIRPPVIKLADVTDVIRARFGPEQRAEVLRRVWQVIEADDTIDDWEEAFADHLARTLGLGADEARAAREGARRS